MYNFLIEFPLTSFFIKALMGFAQQRSLPAVHFTTLESWFNRYQQKIPQEKFKHGLVYLFADEFTNYNDVDLGKKTIKLLNELGFGVKIPSGLSSGRSYLSKGMLIEAKQIAINNLEILQDIITDKHPLIGIEPSAILTFRDEIPDLVGAKHRATALTIKPHCLLIDEFIAQKIDEKIITKEIFTGLPQKILLHGHCHQKAIAGLVSTRKALSFPENFEVELLPSGCCGMAGSFGYEKKHYSMSQKIANLVLFPRILQAKDTVTVASNGTSCRHQLKDGIEKQGFHTAEILYNALSSKTIKG